MDIWAKMSLAHRIAHVAVSLAVIFIGAISLLAHFIAIPLPDDPRVAALTAVALILIGLLEAFEAFTPTDSK